MAKTDSTFAIINILRVDPPEDSFRNIYFDVDGAFSQTVAVACLPGDTSTVFWTRVQADVLAIAQKYVPGKELGFSGVPYPNPDKIIAFARTGRG